MKDVDPKKSGGGGGNPPAGEPAEDVPLTEDQQLQADINQGTMDVISFLILVAIFLYP